MAARPSAASAIAASGTVAASSNAHVVSEPPSLKIAAPMTDHEAANAA